MKFIYLKEDGNFDIACLVTNMLLKEIQENDFSIGWGEVGIRLNRFIYNAGSDMDIILFINYDKPKIELICRYKLENEEDYEYRKIPNLKISHEEQEKLLDFVNTLIIFE